ncbi:B12-binding domain-containing radical SAM protein [Streptomyces sp. NPDC002078]
MSLEPAREAIGIDARYSWKIPLDRSRASRLPFQSVWYIALPLTSAHRGSHSGGGAQIAGAGGQEKYLNEGTVYPHSSLVEMVTYHELCFPDVPWRYIDMSHIGWEVIREQIRENPPDVAAFSVYTATAPWAFIVAAEIKRVNPDAVIVFGNDHAAILHEEVLTGRYGSRLVDFVGTGNNGPFTMMGLLYALSGELEEERVPSLAYRRGGAVVHQSAPTYPLNRRRLPDYSLITDQLVEHYDKAFKTWYAGHYDLQRMITMAIDGGCHWGESPRRRCKHCSIQGLTPKTAAIGTVVSALEHAVGSLGANVYAAGDSTLGFSRGQWQGQFSLLDDLAEACAASPVLKERRFMLAYGLVYEFLQSAKLCQGFVRTWNVGLEAFDPKLLKENSKGINKGPDRIYEALELARDLDYRLYVSGILGLPGTDTAKLRSEVDNWLALAEQYQDIITTVSVAAPAVVPGSRMYWEAYNSRPEVRSWHGEILPSRKLTDLYLRSNTEVRLPDVEAALTDLGRGVIRMGEAGSGMKFGGYMLGGTDQEERQEQDLLDALCRQL